MHTTKILRKFRAKIKIEPKLRKTVFFADDDGFLRVVNGGWFGLVVGVVVGVLIYQRFVIFLLLFKFHWLQDKTQRDNV